MSNYDSPETIITQERQEARIAREQDLGEQPALWLPHTQTWAEKPTRTEAEQD